jgi:hypothetical protein
LPVCPTDREPASVTAASREKAIPLDKASQTEPEDPVKTPEPEKDNPNITECLVLPGSRWASQ